jgi:hypothetical protein
VQWLLILFSYLTSNSLWEADLSFLGAPFEVIQTKLGNTILVLGYLYNFTQNANNTGTSLAIDLIV